MAKDLAKEYVRLRSRLFAERDAIIQRIAVLDELLKAEAPTEMSLPAPAQKIRPGKAARPGPSPEKAKVRTLPASLPAKLKWEIRPDACEFPVAMFPFPPRAHSAFEKNGIQKLGDLNRCGSEFMEQRSLGTTTIQAITDLIQRVNCGELFYPATEPVPTSSYAQLVDAGLAELDQSAAVAVQQRLGNDLTLEAVGSQLGITSEGVRQLEGAAIGQLTRLHGARLFQIGKALGIISKARPVKFSDISDETNPPKFPAEFYYALLGRMFPGLEREMPADGSAVQSDTPNGSPAPVVAEPPSPNELRERIFFGSETGEPVPA